MRARQCIRREWRGICALLFRHIIRADSSSDGADGAFRGESKERLTMVMSKSTPPVRENKGLGRRLGHLLKGDRIVGAPIHSATPVPRFGRGMETLVTAKQAEAEKCAKSALLPAWFFFTADLLLLGFTVALLFSAPKPLAGSDVIFAAVCVGFGCVLGLCGIVQAAEEFE